MKKNQIWVELVDMSKMLFKTKLNSKAHNRYRMKFMKTLEHENVEWNLMNREYNLL